MSFIYSIFVENDKTKGEVFRLLGAAIYGKVNIQGELMEDKSCFSEVCYVDTCD